MKLLSSPTGKWLDHALDIPEDWVRYMHYFVHVPTKTKWYVGRNKKSLIDDRQPFRAVTSQRFMAVPVVDGRLNRFEIGKCHQKFQKLGQMVNERVYSLEEAPREYLWEGRHN